MYQYYEKENYVRNSEKLKEEYEQIVHKNIEEKNFLVEEKKNLEMNLTHYSNALSNAKNEIERLNKIIIEQKKYILNKKEKFNEIINNEKKLQEELKNNIKKLENKINEMEKNNNNFKIQKKKFKHLNLFGNFVNDFNEEDSENKIEFQINKMKKIILDSQIEILELKNKLKKLENEKNTMKEIINFKNKKNLFQKNNLLNLNQIIENQNQKQIFNNYLLKIKNKELKNLRNKSTDNIRNAFNNFNSNLNLSASSTKIIENNYFNKN